MNQLPRLLAGLIIILCAIAIPGTSRAQDSGLRAVLLPVVSGGSQISDDTRRVALDALRGGLSPLGIVIVDPPTPPDSGRACQAGPCVQALVRGANADFAAAIAIWASPDDPTSPDELVVSLIDSVGQSFDARAHVEGDLADAIHRAARVAHAHYRVGPGPFVFIDGSPDAAVVQIDSALAGALPYRGRLEAGTHTIQVSAEGHRSESRAVTIPTDITSTTRLRFELQAAGGEPSALNWILGVAGLGAGLALLTPAIVNLGLDGQCADEGAFGCRTRYRFDGARDGALIGIGGALLLAGVVFLVAQPIRVSASASSEGARLQIEGTFF